ncbi:hypothetical protein PMAYCL1PPCAC_31828, partial [Pristionchus mayeri]
LQQKPITNRTIADLWEVYAASSDKYHKKLTELWKNKKSTAMPPQPPTTTSLATQPAGLPSTSTVLPSTESYSTTTVPMRPPTTSAVAPRTIKVINILKRLLPDYIPQLSSIFEHVQNGNDLLMLGVTPPATTTTTTYFAKKSSFKRPVPAVQVTYLNATAPLHRTIHRMAPRQERRTQFSKEPSEASVVDSTTVKQPSSPYPTSPSSSSYTPQFPLASLDPNFNAPMNRLPESIFGAAYSVTPTQAAMAMPLSTMPEPSPSSTSHRISYLPTGGTTLPPSKLVLPSAGSFPEFLRSLSNMNPIPAKEMTQQFLAYPPSNPKFIFAAPQQN